MWVYDESAWTSDIQGIDVLTSCIRGNTTETPWRWIKRNSIHSEWWYAISSKLWDKWNVEVIYPINPNRYVLCPFCALNCHDVMWPSRLPHSQWDRVDSSPFTLCEERRMSKLVLFGTSCHWVHDTNDCYWSLFQCLLFMQVISMTTCCKTWGRFMNFKPDANYHLFLSLSVTQCVFDISLFLRLRKSLWVLSLEMPQPGENPNICFPLCFMFMCWFCMKHLITIYPLIIIIESQSDNKSNGAASKSGLKLKSKTTGSTEWKPA